MDNESETQVDSSASGRKDPGWKYVRLVNEKDLNTIICIFGDKVTKWGIYRHKQHLVGGYRNAKKCRKCLEYVREEMKEYISVDLHFSRASPLDRRNSLLFVKN